jgi:hypothetical protein
MCVLAVKVDVMPVMRRGGAIDGASRLSTHDCRLREPMIIVYKVFCDYDITCAEMLRNICVNLNIDAKQEGGVIKNIAVWEVHSEEDFYQGKCDTSSTSTVWAYSPHLSLSEVEATVCADGKEYILLFVAVNNE